MRSVHRSVHVLKLVGPCGGISGTQKVGAVINADQNLKRI